MPRPLEFFNCICIVRIMGIAYCSELYEFMSFFVCVWRFLPPEIGCLKKLVELDLSCNKLKSLPDDIASLEALVSLRVANNKLVDLPSAISGMKMLESLDISNNRLTSLQPLDLSIMHALRSLNIQVNLKCVICFSYLFV